MRKISKNPLHTKMYEIYSAGSQHSNVKILILQLVKSCGIECRNIRRIYKKRVGAWGASTLRILLYGVLLKDVMAQRGKHCAVLFFCDVHEVADGAFKLGVDAVLDF